MASIAKLQSDLNVLLMQETKANSEKHLVLSMLSKSYTKKLQDIGYGCHALIGFYQEAVEVLNQHFKENKLSNLLTDTSNSSISEDYLQKARSSNGLFSQRWGYLDFGNAISIHLESTSASTTLVEESDYPQFIKSFFNALKNLRA